MNWIEAGKIFYANHGGGTAKWKSNGTRYFSIAKSKATIKNGEYKIWKIGLNLMT